MAGPGGYGGLSAKQRGLADAGGTYAHADGWKSCDKVKLDMFTGHKLQVDTMSNVGPYARMQGL